MKKSIYVGGCAFLLLAISACTTDFSAVRVDDFRVENIDASNLKKIRVDVSLKVVNPTKRTLELKAADFDVLNDGAVFAHLRMIEPVLVPARSDDYRRLPLELQITDVMALLTMNINLRELNLEQWVLNGSVKLKAGIWSRTRKVENATLAQVLQMTTRQR
jgi:LEA14-like dessication related protein